MRACSLALWPRRLLSLMHLPIKCSTWMRPRSTRPPRASASSPCVDQRTCGWLHLLQAST
ncbi:hypothetical protein PF010_g33293 [Phytophthora fragariae]|uniref:Uncharacterized protein n=1 Tax=Phytophthora fragariae TaxID=53985 RepID=A0A6A4AKI6_9STRA|nr:hypothetical protein PF010_g33293 [Phytophthora fragariae]KAE9053436.1 hypothetical protein PF006_g33564 [Phytophthora fragariae]KAE9258719.1 hypothetical protein PF001_g33267 [Phytophthora fragariae]